MSTPLISKRLLWWSVVCAISGAAGYFLWLGKPYGEPCFSPNHDYYIISHQSWISTLFSREAEYGTARLYDKNHRLLNRGDVYLDGQAGPVWSDNVVVYQGTSDGVYWELPSTPGPRSGMRQCY